MYMQYALCRTPGVFKLSRELLKLGNYEVDAIPLPSVGPGIFGACGSKRSTTGERRSSSTTTSSQVTMLAARASAVRSASRIARSFATVVDTAGVKVAAIDNGEPTSSVTFLVKAGSRFENKPGVAHALQNFAFKVCACVPGCANPALTVWTAEYQQAFGPRNYSRVRALRRRAFLKLVERVLGLDRGVLTGG